MYDQITEVADGINYLGVSLESTGGWIKYEAELRVKGNQTLMALNVYQEHQK
jgi:hypothetical protein